MGRWGTDVVALACIAGGAVVGSGVTAALFASPGEREAQRVEVVCASEAPQVVVRLSSGTNATSTRTIHVRSHSVCDESVHVDVAGMGERMDEARQRMDEARLRMDEARVRVEEARGQIESAEFRIQEVHEVREIARLRLEGVEEELVEVEELRAEELRAVLERVKADVERARASGGND